MAVFLSELEIRFSLHYGPKDARFDNNTGLIAQDDLDVSVSLLSRRPCDPQPQNDPLLEIPWHPVQSVILSFGIEADSLARGRASLQFKPVIAGKGLSAGADDLNPRHGLIEGLIVEGDEQMPGSIIAFGVKSNIHSPRRAQHTRRP
jgi:hypothetical protein